MNKIESNIERSRIWSEARAKGHVSSQELGEFFLALNAKVTAAFLAEYPTCEANHYTLVLKVGMKFAKLSKVRAACEGGYAYAFIDLTNGDILKPASWKAPAKHARGNIRIGDASNWWQHAMDENSVAYLY